VKIRPCYFAAIIQVTLLIIVSPIARAQNEAADGYYR
jgi:hypothetical protein